MIKASLFLFIALSVWGSESGKTYTYDGKPLNIDVSRTDLTHFVFDEEMANPIKRNEQNLEFNIQGKDVWFRYMPKIKYQMVGDKKVEVDRVIEAKREHFYLISKSGKSYEIFFTPREGFAETITVHDAQIEKEKVSVFETKDTRNLTILNLAKSVFNSEVVSGYKFQEINELVAKEKNYNAYLKRRFTGNLYVAEVYEIEALQDNYYPDEYNFKKLPIENKVFISAYDWERPLKKGQTTELVIVGYRQ